MSDFWKGNNSFILEGKIIVGPKSDVYYVHIFLSFVFMMTLIFYLFILPNVVITNKLVLGTFFGITLFLFLIFYILTVITEPGYLPHQNILMTPEYIQATTSESQKLIKYITSNPNYNFVQHNHQD